MSDTDPVADSVNRGIGMTRRTRATYTIKLSINENLKLRKRKGKDKQQHEKIYTIPNHVRVT
jgi:ABC-type branched-subunit amino acid transport system ATPase component